MIKLFEYFNLKPVFWNIFFISSFLYLIFFYVFQKDSIINLKKSIKNTILWIICAFIFSILVWINFYFLKGQEIANRKILEFINCYIIEKSLSIDNIFFWILIFEKSKTSYKEQNVILKTGIIFSLLNRIFLIQFGIKFFQKFHQIYYFMGAFLFFSGLKIFFEKNRKKDQKFLNKVLITKKYLSKKLFLIFLFIEVSNIIFSIDSIATSLIITKDNLIVFSSNFFSIFGIRSLYFLILHMKKKFIFFRYILANTLIFIGIKMLFMKIFLISNLLSLFFMIANFIIFSFLSIFNKK
ncbi:TerC family protein [bacterium endosymbiont of Pedicinus badii]|uniref:TerC family protein n=1 Tax=bacterium endosymbiont of Pedicinus badii TaxID=1719126 RepID=UPI0009BA15C8|nr:hypothetical protein [bacterium endosymbiont of Pedicinus badii]